MKCFMTLSIFISLVACSSDWESGREAQEAMEEERASEIIDSTNKEFPSHGKPGTDQFQPF